MSAASERADLLKRAKAAGVSVGRGEDAATVKAKLDAAAQAKFEAVIGGPYQGVRRGGRDDRDQ